MIPERSSRLLRAFLVVSALEGVFAWLFLFRIPSMNRNAWLMGFSLSRLVVGGLILPFLLFSIGLAGKALFNPDWLKRSANRVVSFFSDEDHLAVAESVLSNLSVLGLALFLLFQSSFAAKITPLPFIFERIRSVVLWGIVTCLQALGVLGLLFPKRFLVVFRRGIALKTLLILLVLTLTLAHWILLIFQLDLLASIPGWFWPFHPKDFLLEDLLFPLVASLFLGIIWWVLHKPQKVWRNLMLLIALGYITQVSFGYIEGQGFESLRIKYIHSTHRVYAQHASDNPDLYKVISEYEQLYGKQQLVQTKPPGLLVFYIVTQKIARVFIHGVIYQERYYSLTAFASYVYPLLTFLVLIPLFWLGRLMMDEQNALMACILYLSIPIVILMPLFVDEVLFPMLFVSCALAMTLAVHHSSSTGGTWKSFLLAVLAGVLFYLAVFCSFSLVTLLPLFLILLAIFLFQERQPGLKPAGKILLGAILGFLGMYLLFLVIFKYEPLGRFVNAMTIHYQDDFFKRFGVEERGTVFPSLNQRLGVLFLNLVSYAVWIGLPLFSLYVAGGVRVIIQFWKDRKNRQLGFLVAFLLTMVALFTSGEAAGEVARHWTFFTPILALFSSREIPFTLKGQKKWVIALLVLQLITTYLTYKFQDFAT